MQPFILRLHWTFHSGLGYSTFSFKRYLDSIHRHQYEFTIFCN